MTIGSLLMMSLVKCRDLDDLVLSFCDLTTDFTVIMKLNHYHYNLITTNALFIEWLNLHTTLITDSTISYHDNLFISACGNGSILAKYLYRHYDVNVNELNNKAFRDGCANGHLDIVKWLLPLSTFTQVEHDVINLVVNVCCGNHLPVLQFLYSSIDIVKHIINIHTESLFVEFCSGGCLEIVKWLWEVGSANINMSNELILRYACKSGNVDLVNWLVNLTDDKCANVMIAFHYACKYGDYDLVNRLITFSITYTIGLIDIHDNDDYALRVSVRRGRLEIVMLLLELSRLPFGPFEVSVLKKVLTASRRPAITDVLKYFMEYGTCIKD